MDRERRSTHPVVFGARGLQALIDVLREQDREVLGPVVRDDTVAVRPLTSVAQLPTGRRADQQPGSYRLHDHGDTARFRWAVGPQTWKPLVHPPAVTTMTMTQHDPHDAVRVDVRRPSLRRRAFVGMRPCELAALGRLDDVLLDPARPEPVYAAERSDVFTVVVECSTPAATCFCPSTGTGPFVGDDAPGHDLRLVELDGPDGDVRYVATPASDEGVAVLDAIAANVTPASPDDRAAVHAARAEAVGAIRRRLDTSDLATSLPAAHGHPHWAEIGARCVACGNCTAVCPTCFCTATDDVGDLEGEMTERRRRWESCFSLEFTRLGDVPVRSSVTSRYRHWLTHKLGTWHDQFGASGCVGCGRCITWCPVGIDLTEEVPRLVEVPT